MKCLLLFVGGLFMGTDVATAQEFPDRLVGTWTGMIHMYKDGQLRDSVQIRFTVGKPSTPGSWPWKTEYLSTKMPMTKDYTLRLLDAASKTYTVDEGGGIELRDYLFGNKLYGVFETQETMLTSSYELRGTELIFEVTSGKKISSSTAVTSYTVTHLQRAILRRLTP